MTRLALGRRGRTPRVSGTVGLVGSVGLVRSVGPLGAVGRLGWVGLLELTGLLGSLVLLGLAPAACGRRTTADEASAEASRDDPPPRRFADVAWREIFRIGGSLDDTLLLQPGRLAADRHGVVVADLHGGRAMRFDPEGRLMWSYGRKGRGPDELAHPRDLKLDALGRTWILDAENGRVVVLSPDGRPARRIRLDGVGLRPDDLVPLDDGGALLLVADAERPLVRVDGSGAVLGRAPFPWPGFAGLHPMASQLVVGTDPGSGRWAAAFQLGDGFFIFRRERGLGARGRFVEPVPFARPVRHRSGDRFGRSETVTTLASPTFAAWSATLSGDHLYVLFIGRTDRGGRLLDVYGLADGTYRETLLLPRRVDQVAYGDGTFYATYGDPYPTLLAWRPRREAAPRPPPLPEPPPEPPPERPKSVP